MVRTIVPLKTSRFIHLLFIAVFACTSPDHATTKAETLSARAKPTHAQRRCRLLVWHSYNTNSYLYTFDSTQHLRRCEAVEHTFNQTDYPLNQQLLYTKEGLLDQVRDERGFSQYHYQNGQLVSIDFSLDGQPIYRYQISTNTKGQIVRLQGIPLNDSGLLAYSTQYRLDEQGRYVQLDVRNNRNILFYRIIQRDFDSSVSSPYQLIRGVPYDLNRYPWINWGQTFPLSDALAQHVEIYRYAPPETPNNLIKRSDVSSSWRTDTLGYLTGQFSVDALSGIRDTVSIDYFTYP